jgi:serine protease
MKRQLLALTILSLSILISCNPFEDDLPTPSNGSEGILISKKIKEEIPTKDPLSREEINRRMITDLEQKNDFRWMSAGLHFIWSGARQTNLVAVGYKPARFTNSEVEEMMGTIDIRQPEWKSVHDAMIRLVLDDLNSSGNVQLKPSDIIDEDDADLPVIIFRMNDARAITALYNLENTRYVEPYGYWPYDDDRSSSGCSAGSEPLNSADWTTTLPNSRLPWNYNSIGVPQAWNVAQGQGIQIGLIDAGISINQPLLNGLFNDGYSNVGRNITTSYTYGSSAFTSCTHGTSMSGLAAGPRNGQDATTGIAYKSGLYFIRGCDDVVLDESAELSGVRSALVRLGKVNSVKIISMSIGTPFYSYALYDGVTYAYGRGKMLIAAAGTSFSWTSWWGVIYPAAHPQCIAVTGVNESGSTCGSCHDGSQVRFTVPMERDVNDNRHGLSLAYSGYTPTYIGGSSCATAMCAGVAALVWSVRPSLTRSQVYDCLRTTSQYYPGTVSGRGYGNINAAAAVAKAQTL